MSAITDSYAVIYAGIDPTTGCPRTWVMSLHSARNLAEARLTAYLAAGRDGTWESLQVLSQWLPAGVVNTLGRTLTVSAKGTLSLASTMRVVRVTSSARERAWMRGKFFSRKETQMRRNTG